jgi:hypothetical protein
MDQLPSDAQLCAAFLYPMRFATQPERWIAWFSSEGPGAYPSIRGIALRTRGTQLAKISFTASSASDGPMETFTVSACGNQFTATALPSPVKGRTELLSSTRSCEVSSLYLPLAMARTSRIPAGLLNSPTISLKDAVFLTGQRSFIRPPNSHPTLLVNSRGLVLSTDARLRAPVRTRPRGTNNSSPAIYRRVRGHLDFLLEAQSRKQSTQGRVSVQL